MSAAQSVSDNSFSREWEAQPGLQLTVSTPFYVGNLEATGRYMEFERRGRNTSGDYTSVFLAIGWSYSLKIVPRLFARPGFRFGNNRFHFDEAKQYTRPDAHWTFTFDDDESEFAYELFLGLEYRLSRHWSLTASLNHNRTMTYHPLPVTMLTGGIRFSLDSPNWIKEILR